MFKRTLSMLLLLMMILALFAGCSKSGASKDSSSSEKETSTSEESSAGEKEESKDEKPAHIVVESLYFDAVPRDLEKVEAAINEITIPAINVEVELYPLGLSESAQQVSLMISSGSQMDLIVNLGRSDFLSLVNKNMLLDLKDLLDNYGQGIIENAPNAIEGGYVGDTLYGIPSVEKYGNTYGLLMAKEVTDAVGWTKFEDLTPEELGEFLAQAHELYPDKTLIQLSGGGGNVSNFDYMYDVDDLGAGLSCGGILGIGKDEGDQIVNIFATDEYKEFCNTMHAWYEAGYINQDAATCTENVQSFVQNGQAVGYFLQTELDMVPGQTVGTGVELVALNTRSHTLVTQNIASGLWSIPYTCENPEAAMKFMNMMWDNEDIINLIYYGIEGLDYQVVDDGSGRIGFLDGESPQTCGYHQWFGIYGNTPRRLTWIDLPADYKDQLQAFNNDVNEDNTSKYLGYCFNPESVKTQYAAVQDVISTYRTPLECGVVDPETMLPQFISALEAAGINDIIAANQAALDEWKAAQK